MTSKDTFSASLSRINVKQTRVSFSSLPKLGQVSDTIASRSTGDIPLDADSLKVLIIQNDLLCNPCTAIQSLIEFEITYHVIYAFHDNALKSVHPLLYEAIIILGGRHGAYEETEWLKKEKEFIRKALRLDVPILGICLGCQLLAECVCGKVYAGTKGIEIGYKFWKYHSEETEEKSVQSSNIQKKMKHHERINSASICSENKSIKEPIPSTESKEMEEEDIDFNEDEFDEETFDKEKPLASDGDDKASSSLSTFHPADFDDDEVEVSLDPFVYALACEDRDQYIILFHGDTFDLPSKCAITHQHVQILANTNKYTSLFRVGQYSC